MNYLILGAQNYSPNSCVANKDNGYDNGGACPSRGIGGGGSCSQANNEALPP